MKKLFPFILVAMAIMFISTDLLSQEVKPVPVATAKDNTFSLWVDFHCPGGKNRLETQIIEFAGVSSVTADLGTKIVTIEHDSEVVTTQDLVRIIERVGHRTEYTTPETKIKHACSHGDGHDHDHDHDHDH